MHKIDEVFLLHPRVSIFYFTFFYRIHFSFRYFETVMEENNLYFSSLQEDKLENLLH